MKKVAFFTTSLNAGGIENYLLRFLQFSQTVIKPYVVCKAGIFGELECEYKKINNIELVKLNVGYFNPITLYKVYKFLRKNKIDAVCDFTGNFSGVILLVSKLANVNKRVVFYRGSSNHFRESFLKLKYNNRVQKLVKQYATNILFNSKTALEYFFPHRSSTDHRYKIIYNGVSAAACTTNLSKNDCRKEYNISANAFVVGHTGRYNHAKNHITIAKVANELCDKYHDIYFVLCGKNTEIVKKEAIVLYPHLHDRLIALGYQSKVAEVLKTFDVFFFPSVTEGQPNALIEAMIAGLPAVASNIEPVKETTPAQLHCVLKDPLDVEGFKHEIEKVYCDKSYAQQLIFSDWAKASFEPEILFNQFLSELIN
jgi:glycosyltransferase involved in cell wall biosynthesis